MHFMFTRAAGPPCVNGCVCADPHDGHAGRTGRPSARSAGVRLSFWSSVVIGTDGTRRGATQSRPTPRHRGVASASGIPLDPLAEPDGGSSPGGAGQIEEIDMVIAEQTASVLPHLALIGGRWVEGSGGTFEVRSPYSGELVNEITRCSPADVDRAVAAAAAAQPGLGGDAVDRSGEGAPAHQRAVRRAGGADRARARTGDRQDDHGVAGRGARVRGAVVAQGRRRGAPAPRALVPLDPGADEQQAPGPLASTARGRRGDHPVQLPDRHRLDRASPHRGGGQHRRVEALRVRGHFLRDGRRVLRRGGTSRRRDQRRAGAAATSAPRSSSTPA